MGRKSLAPLRQQEILDAFERCIEKYGFAQSSTRRIADEAGINQPMIAHYFGNKETLVTALVSQVFDRYRSRLRDTIGQADGSDRLKLALDFVFGPGVLGKEAKGNTLGQLLVAAKQDDGLRARMKAMYEGFYKLCEEELQLAFPQTSQEECKQVAYGIVCLGVGNDILITVELPYSNRMLARFCAERLISRLET